MKEAIKRLDEIAKILVNAACASTLLKAEEEDLESYFLRVIEMKGDLK